MQLLGTRTKRGEEPCSNERARVEAVRISWLGMWVWHGVCCPRSFQRLLKWRWEPVDDPGLKDLLETMLPNKDALDDQIYFDCNLPAFYAEDRELSEGLLLEGYMAVKMAFDHPALRRGRIRSAKPAFF